MSLLPVNMHVHNIYLHCRADPEILNGGWLLVLNYAMQGHTIPYTIVHKGLNGGGWLATHFTPVGSAPADCMLVSVIDST